MKLVSRTVNGNVHDVVAWINYFNLDNVVHSIVPTTSSHIHIVIFKFAGYHSYVHYCDKISTTPMSPEKFFERQYRLPL